MSKEAVAQTSLILVEDDEALRMTLRRGLEVAGYRVFDFPDYHGVIEKLETTSIDLLITDIRLTPNTPHGVAIARMARMRATNLPLILITAYKELAEHGDPSLGPMLVKPVEIETLIGAVETALSGRMA